MLALPQTTLGKWSVGLNAVFLLIILTAIVLVQAGNLSFDDRWWDVTSFIASLLTLVAFVTGIVAARHHGQHSMLVLVSMVVSSCAILFALLHSLFISD